MKVTYQTCCGVDVHKSFLVATIVKTTGGIEPSYQKKRFSTFNNSILEFKQWLLDNDCHDVCMESTQLNYAVLSANWGSGSKHDGEQYELHLCEACFFATVATLKREHRVKQMFNEDFNEAALEKFGRK